MLIDVLILSSALAPLALLQTCLNQQKSFITTRSIFFTQHNWIFRWSHRIFSIALLGGLYLYAQMNGFLSTLLLFIVSLLVQGIYYAILKKVLPGEIFLLPAALIGLVLFYSNVV